MKTRNRVPWFVLVLAGCASDPGTGPSPREDAGTPNDVAVVDNDRPAPPPDAVRKDDAGTPAPDAPDAGVPQDVQQPEDHGPPPPDATMGFDRAICETFEMHDWRVEGTTQSGSIGCDMTSPGPARIWIDTLASSLGIGYTEGACDGITCRLPTAGATDGCTWSGMSPTMRRFDALCNGRMLRLEAVPRAKR